MHAQGAHAQGAHAQAAHGAWQPPPPPRKQGMSTGAIVGIVLAVTIIPIIGIMAVLAIYGVRKYISNAKTAEARNALTQIAKHAVAAYESESEDGKRHLCASASEPVPADRSAIRGHSYRSSRADWERDAKRDAGFACLKFEMIAPQYFQYEYEATATGFTARAHGDLNGDGLVSTFTISGQVVDGQLRLAPSIAEIDPTE